MGWTVVESTQALATLRDVEYGLVVDGTSSAAMPGLVWSWVGKCRSDGPPEVHGPGNVGSRCSAGLP